MLRDAEHKALKTLELSGSILDLGGDARSAYRGLISGNHTFTGVNLDLMAAAEITHDLELPLPLADASYDHVLLINVLEHVFEYRQLLSEAARVVRPGGNVVIVVPFLFPIHPSPSDFWRFTLQALERECVQAGLTVEKVTPLGSGVFAAQYVMIDRLLPVILRLFGYWVMRPIVLLLDRVFVVLARLLKKRYDPTDYSLGYFVKAVRT